MQLHSIYLHIPFCQKRCSYCDFNTFAGIDHLIPAYVDAICKEIVIYGNMFSNQLPVHTVFFGGGTPSLLKEEQFTKIIQAMKAAFALQEGLEFTIEANPGTVDEGYLKNLFQMGVNRISFGVQSFNSDELVLMGRIHDNIDTIRAVYGARKAGFEDINLDLIYGLPNQTKQHWETSLKAALDLSPTHFSLYALGIEEDTPLHDWTSRGLLAMPDDDLAAEMYEYAVNLLAKDDYHAYEISNFALSNGKRKWMCKHNLQYWHNQPYLGLGAGAAGWFDGIRTENVKSVPAYIQHLKNLKDDEYVSPVVETVYKIDTYTAMQETMMVGLRLVEEGVNIKQFKDSFGKDPRDVFAGEIKALMDKNYLEITPDEHIRITKQARLLGNQVFRYFV